MVLSTTISKMSKNILHLEDAISIDASIESVWAYLTDFRNVPKWHKNMIKSTWKGNPPYGVGSEYDWIEKAAGKTLDIGGAITTWNLPYCFEWRPHINPYNMSGGWKLESRGNATHVIRYSDTTLFGFFKWFSFLIVPMIKKQVHAEMQQLKRLIEIELQT